MMHAANSKYYLQKQRTLTHSTGIWKWLFLFFEVEATLHQQLRSENLTFHSEVGSFQLSIL